MRTVEIRTSIPVEQNVALSISPLQQSMIVNDALLNRDQAGSVSQIGTSDIQDRVGTVPGRSIQDLVITQPGWLYEGNAVLHPRGSEYQTQFVIDGIPLTDNRSPSFGPEIEADDLMSWVAAGSQDTSGFERSDLSIRSRARLQEKSCGGC